MSKSRSRKKSKARRSNARKDTRSIRLPRSIEPSGVLLDLENKRLVVVTKDVLINQLRRDGPRIKASFDKLCDRDLNEISELMSDSVSLLLAGLMVATRLDVKLKISCAELLLNAYNSFGAATQLLRAGYCLQPGILIRSMLEAISTVLHLIQKPNDFAAYKSGKLQSTQTISAAKKAVPLFGQLYGCFSENFAHISQLHRSINKLCEYTERHQALEVNLRFLRIAAWLLYLTIELLFNELVEHPRYWRPVSEGYVYDPSESERTWMEEFLRGSMVV